MLIYIEGQISSRKYTDQSGVEKYITEVVLQGYNCQLTMVDNRGESFNSDNINSPNLENPTESKNTTENIQGIEIDDDVPFLTKNFK